MCLSVFRCFISWMDCFELEERFWRGKLFDFDRSTSHLDMPMENIVHSFKYFGEGHFVYKCVFPTSRYGTALDWYIIVIIILLVLCDRYRKKCRSYRVQNSSLMIKSKSQHSSDVVRSNIIWVCIIFFFFNFKIVQNEN